MRKSAKVLSTASAIAVLMGSIVIVPGTSFAADAENGKKVAEDRKKGNCFTCHDYQGAHLAGNMGPSLNGVGKRLSKEQIYNQIWDATKSNPNTTMPPFGKHEVLNKKEIEDIAEWVSTL